MPRRRLAGVELSYEEAAMSKAMEVQDQSFEALFAAHYHQLARLIYRVVGDTGYAEELASEAFWKLHRSPPAFHQNLAGWLYRTGLRLALDGLKKQRRRALYEGAAPGTTPIPTPEQDLARREEQARVRLVLSALKPEFALLLILRSEGLTLKESAAALDCNPSSVGTFTARAETAFRKEWERRYGKQ
ncbi:MAG TPA: sigma-70 family RNA polymerase sigma factor [Bryobacteraceae bacterium]|nr:sigma-70 family RNA polymerase sigma factor [Bryobacteraceae bacterium]